MRVYSALGNAGKIVSQPELVHYYTNTPSCTLVDFWRVSIQLIIISSFEDRLPDRHAELHPQTLNHGRHTYIYTHPVNECNWPFVRVHIPWT